MLSPVKIWRNQKKIASLIGKRGVIVTWTVVRVPPADFMSLAPYPVALIKLDDGNTITAQLVDCDEETLAVGLQVKTVIRRVAKPSEDGIIPYGVKAVLI